MNDLERELRAMLDSDAQQAAGSTPPADLQRKVHRRQLRTVGGGAASVLAIAVATFLVIQAFPSSREPAQPPNPGSPRRSTVGAVTITYPSNWYLIELPAETLNEQDPPDG